MSEIKSILVANRGEIAVRVMRTARALGYRSIAVYSEADAGAPHVEMADGAVLIGPPPVSESYLDADRILEAARSTGADAIHPGYGFLSENAAFARACEKEGIVFIGPGSAAIDLMGNKAEAKRRMIAAGVPCVPGYEGLDPSDEALLEAAREIGFPVMVKAAAGGGGRGMRLVSAERDLLGALGLARAESKSAFGSDELILERAVVRPRHVEVQVFADCHGHVIHLAERDCSVQRRHQKVIEEAPCPVMTKELRDHMGKAAVEAARSIDYRGAGTVEFLLDEAGRFYFLEMNTRLQVEHPVTEMITGLDLVELQIRVAEGKPLGVRQHEVSISGHAIEVRLYAEDPSQDFLPSTGTVELWKPSEREGLRFDSGIRTGLDVSPFYDPMVAKIIAWAPTREAARRRLVACLEETAFFGPRSNQSFLRDCLETPTFIAGESTTALIEEEFGGSCARDVPPSSADVAVAAVLEFIDERETARAAAVAVAAPLSNWSSTGRLATHYRYRFGDDECDVAVSTRSVTTYSVRVGEVEIAIDSMSVAASEAVLRVDGKRFRAIFKRAGDGRMHVSSGGRTRVFENLLGRAEFEESAGGDGRVVAPMHGIVVEILVGVGDEVCKGDRLCVVEAMKMHHEILAEVDGEVTDVLVQVADQVAAGQPLLEITEAEDAK